MCLVIIYEKSHRDLTRLIQRTYVHSPHNASVEGPKHETEIKLNAHQKTKLTSAHTKLGCLFIQASAFLIYQCSAQSADAKPLYSNPCRVIMQLTVFLYVNTIISIKILIGMHFGYRFLRTLVVGLIVFTFVAQLVKSADSIAVPELFI